jgi:hypothetical protein
MAIRRAAKQAPAKKRRVTSAKPKADARPRTFWDDLADIGRSIPPKELAFLPRDAAERFDEYFDSGALKP